MSYSTRSPSAPSSPRQPSRIPTRTATASRPPPLASSSNVGGIGAASPPAMPSLSSDSSRSAVSAPPSTSPASPRIASLSIAPGTPQNGSRGHARRVSQPRNVHSDRPDITLKAATAAVAGDSSQEAAGAAPSSSSSTVGSTMETRERSTAPNRRVSMPMMRLEGGRPQSLVYPAPIRFPSQPHPPPLSAPSGSSSTSPGADSAAPTASPASLRRSHCPARPKLERPSSTCYTSLPMPPPRTPGDEEDDEMQGRKWAKWLPRNWNMSVANDLDETHSAERGQATTVVKNFVAARDDERQPLLEYSTAAGEMRSRDDLPKVTRECLVAEIKCYGKYMLPPLILFLGLALSVALLLYAHARSRGERSSGPT